MDRLSPDELSALFAKADQEAFAALPRCKPAILALLTRLSSWQVSSRQAKTVLLAGAGTSGRLACLLQGKYRAAFKRIGIELLAWLAGGPKALTAAVEGAEDDVTTARRELGAVLLGADCFFIGLSCGLSAGCVAAGLELALERGFGACVLGMNSVDQARADCLPGMKHGFRDLLSKLDARGDFFALLPDVGPELLAGSSRMKGGSVTWLILDAVFAAVSKGDSELEFETACAPPLADFIASAAATLRSHGRIYYLGRGEEGQAAVLDASECPPTFGASLDRVNARLEGGSGFFLEHELATLGQGDLVICMGGVESPSGALEAPGVTVMSLPVKGFLQSKLALQAISTGAFVMAGKVYGNRMIDLRIGNRKLFARARRILEDLLGISEQDALRSLLAAVYGEDVVLAQRFGAPVEEHVRRACVVDGVVPLAFLHAKGLSLVEAREVLRREPASPHLASEGDTESDGQG